MRVLFLCTHNSARSQMAEALLRDLTEGRVDVYSAGTEPREVNPHTIEVLQRSGIHHDGRSKSLEEFRGQTFDFVITTCNEAQEACPQWPGARMVHWTFADPAAVPPEEQLEAFRRTRNELLQRLRLFVQANKL